MPLPEPPPIPPPTTDPHWPPPIPHFGRMRMGGSAVPPPSVGQSGAALGAAGGATPAAHGCALGPGSPRPAHIQACGDCTCVYLFLYNTLTAWWTVSQEGGRVAGRVAHSWCLSAARRGWLRLRPPPPPLRGRGSRKRGPCHQASSAVVVAAEVFCPLSTGAYPPLLAKPHPPGLGLQGPVL